MSDELSKLKDDLQKLEIAVTKSTAQSKNTADLVEKMCDSLEKRTTSEDERYRKIDEALRGKDTDNPGLFTRVASLEGFRTRSTSLAKWFLGILGTVIGALAIAIAMQIIQK